MRREKSEGKRCVRRFKRKLNEGSSDECSLLERATYVIAVLFKAGKWAGTYLHRGALTSGH